MIECCTILDCAGSVMREHAEALSNNLKSRCLLACVGPEVFDTTAVHELEHHAHFSVDVQIGPEKPHHRRAVHGQEQFEFFAEHAALRSVVNVEALHRILA